MAELTVLGAGPVKRGVSRLAEQFAGSSGHRVAVEFAGAPGVRDRVLAGEAVDVVVVPSSAMDDFEKAGRLLAGTRGTVGRSRMGLVLRKGARKADLSTAEAFRQAMLDADQIVCNVASSGQYMVRLLGELGIADATAAKVLKLADAVKVMEHVAASSSRAFGVGQLAEISELTDRGVAVELAAPFPDSVQNVTVYAAAVTAASPSVEAASALARLLTAAASRPVLAATGID